MPSSSSIDEDSIHNCEIKNKIKKYNGMFQIMLIVM